MVHFGRSLKAVICSPDFLVDSRLFVKKTDKLNVSINTQKDVISVYSMSFSSCSESLQLKLSLKLV